MTRTVVVRPTRPFLTSSKCRGSFFLKAYLSLLGHITKNGVSRADRTGTGRSSIFGFQLRHSLDQGFPLLTTKKIHFKSVVHELLWLISGDTNIHYLQSNGVNIWNEWADEKGELGPVYGQQWRRWQGPDGKTYDQLQTAIHLIKTEPHSTRMIVNSWNVADISKMALPPCHAMFQFFCADGKLSLQLYQRSADIFLGVPFNIASYALLLLLVANECGLAAGDFIWTGGDVHLYSNHKAQAELQLTREVLPLPTVVIHAPVGTPVTEIKFEDIELVGYSPHPAIKAPVSV